MKQVKVVSKEGKPWEESLIKTTKNYITDRLMDEDLKSNEEVKEGFEPFKELEPETFPNIDNVFGIDTSKETVEEYTKQELERCKDLKYFYGKYIVERELTDLESNMLDMYMENLNN